MSKYLGCRTSYLTEILLLRPTLVDLLRSKADACGKKATPPRMLEVGLRYSVYSRFMVGMS